jgi:hypothetical protein
VIVGILDNPEQHRANAYPALWPVEYTYPEIAEVLSRALGKEDPVSANRLDSYWSVITSRAQNVPTRYTATSTYGRIRDGARASGWIVLIWIRGLLPTRSCEKSTDLQSGPSGRAGGRSGGTEKQPDRGSSSRGLPFPRSPRNDNRRPAAGSTQ